MKEEEKETDLQEKAHSEKGDQVEKRNESPTLTSTYEPSSEPGQPRSGSGGKSWPWMLLSLVAIVALIFVWFNGNDKSNGGLTEEVGSVNGEVVTKADLYDEFIRTMGGDAGRMLDMLLLNKLIEQEMEKANITVAESAYELELAEFKKQFGGEEAFAMLLMQNGITEEDLKSDLVLQIQVRELFSKESPIDDATLEAYFDENKELFGNDDEAEQVRASHILVETEEEANDIIEKINAGEDFAELAKEHSTDPGSAVQGGDLDFFRYERMVPEFSEAAFSMTVGEVSEPVQSMHGFHIIKVTDRQGAQEYTFETKKDAVKRAYYEEQMQTSPEFSEWFTALREDADMKNNLLEDEQETEGQEG